MASRTSRGAIDLGGHAGCSLRLAAAEGVSAVAAHGSSEAFAPSWGRLEGWPSNLTTWRGAQGGKVEIMPQAYVRLPRPSNAICFPIPFSISIHGVPDHSGRPRGREAARLVYGFDHRRADR